MSTFVILTLCFLLLTLLFKTVIVNKQLERSLFETTALLERLKAAHEKEQLKHIQLQNRKDQVEHNLDLGTKVVESVHKSITNTTFNVIDALASQGRTKDAAKKVQGAHDQGLANSLLKAGIKTQFKDKKDNDKES